MTRTTKTILIIAVVTLLVALLIEYSPNNFSLMNSAPPGIHGHFLLSEYDQTYKTKYDKYEFLRKLGENGLLIKGGRLNDYDPPWDSLSYLIANIKCDTQKIEPYVEFQEKKQNGLTTFRILWINSTPNDSYDTTLYRTLTKSYYKCSEAILKIHGVHY